MDMGAAQLGYVIGESLFSLVLPITILIVCNFIPAAKRKPKIVYGICAALGVAVCFIGVAGGGDVVLSSIAAALSVEFFYRGYARAAKKAAAVQ